MKNFANFGAQFTASRHNQSIGIKLQLYKFISYLGYKTSSEIRGRKVQSKFEPFDVAGRWQQQDGYSGLISPKYNFAK